MEESMLTRIHLIPIRMAAAASALAVTTALLAPGAAGAEGITAEPLTERLAFGDDVSFAVTQRLDGLEPQAVEIPDGTHLAVSQFTIPPGEVFPWHTHPGTVLIGIKEGDFAFVFAEGGVKREYAAGSALVDPGDTPHTAWNPSEETDTVVVATFLGVPAEGGLTLPVPADEAADLDARCGVETPGEHTH
jgi:quercetin dioxygenase-like cupin family protein